MDCTDNKGNVDSSLPSLSDHDKPSDHDKSQESSTYSAVDGDFFQFAVEMAADEVFLMRSDSQIIYVNQSACDKLGYESYELIGKFVWEWDPNFSRERWPGFWADFAENRHIHFETHHRKKTGEIFPVDIRGHLFESHGEQFILAFVEDITEKKKAEKQIYRKANYDQLTQLPNRHLFNDRLEQSIINAQRYESLTSLFFIDLDHFKPINDNFGHDIGDALLKEVARRLLSCVRQEDTVTRLGGDEFVILVENIQFETIKKLAQKIQSSFAEPFHLAGELHEITGSTGVAFYPNHAQESSELLRCADMAMYHAKSKGRNRYHIYETPD